MEDCTLLGRPWWRPSDVGCLQVRRTRSSPFAPTSSAPRFEPGAGTLAASCAPPRSCAERGSNRSCAHRNHARICDCSSHGNYIKAVSTVMKRLIMKVRAARGNFELTISV